MKILITGGEGFIGKYLKNALDVEKISYKIFDKAWRSEYNILDKYQLEFIFETYKPDVVIHLAAYAGVRRSELYPDDYIQNNIQGTKNVVDVCKRHNVKHLISFSSSSVISGDKDEPKTEDVAYAPNSIYGMTKMAGEMIVKNGGVPYTIVRPFTVYGVNGREDQVFYKWLNLIKAGKPIEIYGSETKRGYTHVKDLVDGILELIDNGPVNDILNLGGDEIIQIEDVLKIFKENIKDFDFKRVENPMGDAMYSYADISKAKNILGWKPERDFNHEVTNIIKEYYGE